MTEKGGITETVLHAIFNGHDSITHFMHTLVPGLHENLPNMYAVCIADKGQSPRKIVAGFICKTSYHHDDVDFRNAMNGQLAITPDLNKFNESRYSLLPGRINIARHEIPSENSMVRLLLDQALKHNTFGNA